MKAKIFHDLSALGAGDFAHLDGTLERHLIAVHGLLQDWGAKEPLCSAGLFHAAYGTSGFTSAMVALDRRAKITSLIGREAEQLVYRYCACDRAFVWPQIGNLDPIDFRDRFTGGLLKVGDDDLRDFCELTCANEVEIALNNRAFVSGDGKHLGSLFMRWSEFLSPAALRSILDLWPTA